MIYLFMFIFTLSFGLTWGLRSYAIAKQIMDTPNHRSAHTVPTPRGGGLAFVFSTLIAIPFLKELGFLTPDGSLALMAAGVFVASLGFLDDHGHVAPIWRLVGHFTACILALYWMGGFPPLVLFTWTLSGGMIVNGLGLLYLVWCVNLYNFMDGIDGLAAIEAVTACAGMAFLYWLCGQQSLMVLPLALMVSVGGFLCWNFPPARIFMGDAGSGFLGFIVGVLSIQSAFVNPQFFWSWLIILGVFFVDATFTLLRRLGRLEKIYEAHATHGYQYASRYFGHHVSVTMGIMIINVIWLFPIALCVGLDKLNGLVGLMIAYLPLVLLAYSFDAGKKYNMG